MGLLALQPGSKFNQAYSTGQLKKSDYWEYTLEDSITMIAQMPELAARIYRRSFHDGVLPTPDKSLDWAGNYAHMLGIGNNPQFLDVLRAVSNGAI